MNVTSEILFFLYSDKYPLIQEHTGLLNQSVTSIRRLVPGEEPDKEALYILTVDELKPIEETDGFISAMNDLREIYLKEPSKLLMSQDLLFKDPGDHRRDGDHEDEERRQEAEDAAAEGVVDHAVVSFTNGWQFNTRRSRRRASRRPRRGKRSSSGRDRASPICRR